MELLHFCRNLGERYVVVSVGIGNITAKRVGESVNANGLTGSVTSCQMLEKRL